MGYAYQGVHNVKGKIGHQEMDIQNINLLNFLSVTSSLI